MRVPLARARDGVPQEGLVSLPGAERAKTIGLLQLLWEGGRCGRERPAGGGAGRRMFLPAAGRGRLSPTNKRASGWSDVRFCRARNDPSTARVAVSLFLLLYFSHGNHATTRGARGGSSYQLEICFDLSHRGGDHRCRSAGERRHIPTESSCGVLGRPRSRSRTDDSQRSVTPISWRLGQI